MAACGARTAAACASAGADSFGCGEFSEHQEPAFSLGVMFQPRNDFAQLAGPASAGVCLRLSDYSRADAPPGNEPFGSVLGARGQGIPQLSGRREMVEQAQPPASLAGLVIHARTVKICPCRFTNFIARVATKIAKFWCDPATGKGPSVRIAVRPN